MGYIFAVSMVVFSYLEGFIVDNLIMPDMILHGVTPNMDFLIIQT